MSKIKCIYAVHSSKVVSAMMMLPATSGRWMEEKASTAVSSSQIELPNMCFPTTQVAQKTLHLVS